jgi:hypothetical protein
MYVQCQGESSEPNIEDIQQVSEKVSEWSHLARLGSHHESGANLFPAERERERCLLQQGANGFG